jgi:prolyl oligopeptidase
MRRLLLAALFALAPALSLAAETVPEQPDPYLWLEDVRGQKAMDWVKAEDAKTLSVLEKDPRYAGAYAAALKIAETKDRIPQPSFLAGQIYNTWQDGEHKHGVWRRTSLASYRSASPQWETVLDLDALGKAEGKSWFFHGAHCLQPNERYCLISLSDGGEDAVTVREFDLKTRRFVDGGFTFPKAKQSVTWLDRDHVAVSRDWGPGTLTKSGYAFVVKTLARGQSLDQAKEVFRGAESDQLATSAVVEHDGFGHALPLIRRGVKFFDAETYLLTDHGVRRVALPTKARLEGLAKGEAVVGLDTDWTPAPGGPSFKAGSVVSLKLAELKVDPDHLKPTLIFAPSPRQGVQEVTVTRTEVLVDYLDNVRGRVSAFHLGADGKWAGRSLALPDNATLSLVATSNRSDQAFIQAASFIAPPTLYLAETASGAVAPVKALPPQFEAKDLVVEQFEAASSDGVKIPYFVVHKKDLKRDGSTPTLMFAYGGFQLSQTPAYLGAIGKLWLEQGGAYVIANIRGGGEFGPAWHEAGLKTKRQIIYDDHTAVARDLFARGFTSPRRFGIRGRSNGGLLMGVQFTQHPELWHAVIIGVPLLDMLRYEQLAAGASWVAEYGSVSVPEERAFLAKLSPYNALRPTADYPEPFIFTVTKDDRVGPQQARKFAARLAEFGKPYLFYEDTEGGHSATADPRQTAQFQALEFTYLMRKLVD